ncbi:MAG TPA: hypothetical protein VNT26_12155 [Candidatus Sulfotelmatobacter sp.]|nr:hypothetical protein [Candidatus Sulfotelmatobacter sp.]HWI56357.1 hypothetical protein [Bacillota bacterium]
MKTDRYTKAVLTVIALALVGLLLKPAPDLSMLSTATAQSYNPNFKNSVPIDVRIVGIDSARVGALPVYILSGSRLNGPTAPEPQR